MLGPFSYHGFVRTQAIFLLFGISFLCGSSWLVPQPALPVFAGRALVFVMTAIVSGLCACVMPREAGLPLRTDLRLNLTLGFAMLGAPSVLLLLAELHGAGEWAVVLYALLPLFAGFFSGQWSPAMVVPAGAVLVLLNGTVEFTWAKAAWTIPILAAVGLQAFALHAAKQLRGVSLQGLLLSIACQSIAAAALPALCSALFDSSHRLFWAAIPFSLLPVILGIVVPYVLLYFLLARYEAAPHQAATAQWLQILVTVLEGAALARVRPSWQALAAALAILVCTWIVIRTEETDQTAGLFSANP